MLSREQKVALSSPSKSEIKQYLMDKQRGVCTRVLLGASSQVSSLPHSLYTHPLESFPQSQGVKSYEDINFCPLNSATQPIASFLTSSFYLPVIKRRLLWTSEGENTTIKRHPLS